MDGTEGEGAGAPGGTPVDGEVARHEILSRQAFAYANEVMYDDLPAAYQVLHQALSLDRCPEPLKMRIRDRLIDACVELGRVGEALDLAVTCREWAETHGRPEDILFARLRESLAMGRVGLRNQSIDIMTPEQVARMALARMEGEFEEAAALLDTHGGRFVRVSSLVDRIPLLVTLGGTDEAGEAALAEFPGVLELIDAHPDTLGHLRHNALRAQQGLQAHLGAEADIEALEESVRHAEGRGAIAYAQALNALGGALVDEGRFGDALPPLGEALQIAMRHALQLDHPEARLLFKDSAAAAGQQWLSAAFGYAGGSPEAAAEIEAQLIGNAEQLRNTELSMHLIGRHDAAVDGDVGLTDLQHVLARYEEVSGRPAHYVFLHADRRGTHRILHAKDGSSFSRRPLPATRSDWADLRDALVGALGAQAHGNPARPQDWPDPSGFHAHWPVFGEALARLVTAGIDEGGHIFVCADPLLGRLPLASAPIDGHTLIDRNTLCMIPSGLALVALTRGDTSAGRHAYAFLGTGSRADYERRRHMPGALAVFHEVGDHMEESGALEPELKRVWHDATCQAFLDALAGSARVFATAHGLFSWEFGAEPGLLLSTDDGALPAEHVPTLTADVVGAADLGTDLVCLNACVVGLAKRRGEEAMGFSHALYRSSVRNHVSALWPVYLKSSNAFFISLFDSIEAGAKTYADAFRSAVLATRARYPHLYHWAPFALQGTGLINGAES